MNDIDKKIERLISTSKEVFKENVFPNGAITASNSKRPDYPKGAQDYSFVWPRDAAFVAKACMVLGMNDVPENFFKWCESVIDENNLLWHRYTADGKRAGFVIEEWFRVESNLRKGGLLGDLDFYIHPKSVIEGKMGDELQPDHNGLVLWAIHEYFLLNPLSTDKYKNLIEKLADGLCNLWDTKGKTFKYLYFDLWEEKIGYPNVNITYDVAVACAGLSYAIDMLGDRKVWSEAVSSMNDSIYGAGNDYGVWQAVYGKGFSKEIYTNLFSDNLLDKKKANVTIDAGMLALIYPTDIILGTAERMSFMNYFLNNLAVRGGIIRYPGDTFGGEDLAHSSPKVAENVWPLLSLWTSIALAKSGEIDKAKGYFTRAIERTGDYFPEQIDEQGNEKGARPLALAHAMFVIALKELGYLE